MCGLPKRSELEGESLTPLLSDPRAKRNPTVTTYLPDNHSVRNERWRYTRYSDGGEELYDCIADPKEIRNLASDPKHNELKRELGKWMPKASVPPKPERDAYDFNFERHTWKLKAE